MQMRTLGPAEQPVVIDQVLSILRRWQMSTTEQARLLGVSRSTIRRWRSGAGARNLRIRMTDERYHAFGLVLAIHADLRSVFGSGEGDVLFMRSPNTGEPFCGACPVDWLISGRSANLERFKRIVGAMAN